MVEVKSYISSDLNNEITKRSEELGVTKSEYIRLLLTLDISKKQLMLLRNEEARLTDDLRNIIDKLNDDQNQKNSGKIVESCFKKNLMV